MSVDTSTLPISGGVLLATFCYAALSAFVFGPEIADREIARSDWRATCESNLEADLEATRRPDRLIPQVPDLGGMLCSAYPELAGLCMHIPDPNAAAREAERRARALEDERIRNAASGIGDRCSCAVAVYKETERLQLALYAGSARLIGNAPEDRKAALMRALHSPTCSFGRGG